MSEPLHTGRLVLTPEDPYLVPDDLQALLTELADIGFIEGALQNDPGYLLGHRFLQLVSFMGCSPHIKLHPDGDGEPFCHLRLNGPHPGPILISGRNTQSPRCGGCRKRLNDWQACFDARRKSAHDRLASCPHCGHLQDPVSYDFRQSAGCGRLFLVVENIFPQEAIPSPALLDALKRACDGEVWRYFYQQD
ncbi:MAG: hypothetical protein ABW096_14610 [Candidatus Thiodiazotropha sp.]